MNLYATHRVKEKGIGLLELMLALAIIAILIVMATRYFSKASENQKINLTLQELTEIKNAAYQVQQEGNAIIWANVQPKLTGSLLGNDNGPFIGSKYEVDATAKHVGINTLPLGICAKLFARMPEGTNCVSSPGAFYIPLQ
jgi:type II secretory pathway pseudopilin PulG